MKVGEKFSSVLRGIALPNFAQHTPLLTANRTKPDPRSRTIWTHPYGPAVGQVRLHN
jgi:hypothetical protein